MNIIIPLHTFYIPRLCPITFTGPPQQIDNNVLCRSVTQQGTLARRRDTSSSAPGGSSIQPEGAITMGLGRGCHAPVASVAGRRSNSGHPQTAAAQAARGAATAPPAVHSNPSSRPAAAAMPAVDIRAPRGDTPTQGQLPSGPIIIQRVVYRTLEEPYQGW